MKSKIKKCIILSTIIAALCLTFICVKTAPVKAYSSNTTPVTIESHMGEITTTHIEVVITLNFADYYSGYISFTIYNRSNQPVSYYALNAKLTNMTNTGFRTEVNQTKYAEVHIFYQTESLQQACYNAGLIASNTFGLFTTYLNTNWKTTTDVKNSNWSSSTLYVDNPVDDVLSEVTSIDTNISEIESYLNSIQTNTTNEVTYLYRISSSIDKLLTFDIEPYQYSAFLLFDAYMNNAVYDNTLSLPRFDMAANTGMRWDFFIRLKKDEKVYFVYYMDESTISSFNYAPNDNNTFTLQRNDPTITSRWHLYCDVITNTSSGTLYVTPTNSSSYTICPVFLGNYSQMPTSVRDLLSYNSKETDAIYNARDAIVNAIDGITVTVENDTEINNYVTANDNSITTITDNHETINNITNDFNLDFGTADNAITLDINSLPNLTNTATFWNGKSSELDIELEDFHYPIWLGFVLLALMAMIGV